MDRIVVEQVAEAPVGLRELLEELDALHQLRDSRFSTPDRLTGTDPHRTRFVAVQDGALVGFLSGRPRLGHIANIGVRNEGVGIGTALLDTFLTRAQTLGATEATVVIDSEPTGRWRRRRFFEARQFQPSQGSALHYHRPLVP
ncbi:GNAT family N-acetyltransferase [Nocardia salmonicida]|uniref:GNAT family N-acetyltransferase n=1 Tax=Nocardia salmonicida TaxID=53431 RepID=UPI0007A50099|nr:GNAT family N-acetyltransferase [Nocardia salmonicida]